MTATVYFGYLLVTASAALLASHWHQWRDLTTGHGGDPLRAAFLRLQIQRRSVASALIGVVGAAMTLVQRVPPDPKLFTAYVLALVWGGAAILVIAISDWRAVRRYRDRLQMDVLAKELKKIEQAAAPGRRE